MLEELLEMGKSKTSSALVLNAIINSFKPDFISSRALNFAELIKDADETALPKVRSTKLCMAATRDETSSSFPPFQYKLYVSLGNCVVMSDPPTKDRLPLLNTVSFVCSLPGKVQFSASFMLFQICRCGKQ